MRGERQVVERSTERIAAKLSVLRCVRCRNAQGSLVLEAQGLRCTDCDAQYPIVDGIPIFSIKKAQAVAKRGVLRGLRRKCQTAIRLATGTPLWFTYLAYVSLAERTNFFSSRAAAVHQAVSALFQTDWASSIPYNLYLKAIETRLFANLDIRRPCLEVGGGGGDTSRLAFAGRRIDVDCEYYLDNVWNNLANGADIHSVTDLHVGGSVYDLPCPDESFGTVVMVHIVDHLVDINGALGEVVRVLRPSGLLAFSTYSETVFRHLPLFMRVNRLHERVATAYLDWKTRREYPWDGYSPFVCDEHEEATGQNLFGFDTWRQLGERHKLRLVKYQPFTIGRIWSGLMDLQYRGDPRLFRTPLNRLVSHFVEKELSGELQLDDRDAANVFMVFQKTR